jgi:hypothetical protein
MSIRRRGFLGSLGTASVAAALPLTSAAARLPASAPVPVGDTWDMTWADRVKGKNRAVFDSPGFSNGEAVFRAVMWSHNYKEVYGTNPQDMSAVLVIRAEGISLAMNDEFWKKYAIGKRNKLKDGKGGWYDHNPIASTPPGVPPQFADASIPKFIAGGGTVLACHVAFKGGVVSVVQKEDKLKDDEAEKLARTYLLPGVILQPSGVFAVLRAQEAGCHYILAS